MKIQIKKLSFSLFLACTILLLCSSTFIDNPHPVSELCKSSCSNVPTLSSIGGGTGDILGFYTPIFSSGTSPIEVVDFQKPNGTSSGIALTTLSSFVFPANILLPTNTSSYNPTSKELVCLVSGQQTLFEYDDNNCTSGTLNLAPSSVTAPVFLGSQLYGIEIASGAGTNVTLDIVIDIQLGLVAGIGQTTFQPIQPYVFNHEQMSSATNGTDELYFVSGIDLIKVSNLGTFNVLIQNIGLDPNNKYIYYGLEYSRPNVLVALRKNNVNNTTASLELVEIHLNGLLAPTIVILYDLQSKVAPSPPGWILNNEFYSSALDTCDQKYYLSTLYDTNGSSRLIEIDIGNSFHSENIFMDYLFGIEIKDLSCGPCQCGTYSDMSYRPSQGAPNIPISCGETLTAQCDGMIPWTLGGNFMCDGSDCPDSTEMIWTLTKPGGSMTTGPASADPGFNISLPASEFSSTGLYQLVLSAICGQDTCYCEFFIEVQCDTDSCCTDFDAFCALVAQGFTVVTDPVLCKATVTAPQFDTCQWFSTPPFIPGTSVVQVITDTDGMWMFNYNQSGLYTICVNVFEEGSDSICWQKEMCTTFDLFCDPVSCCTDFDTFLIAAQGVDVLGELGDCMIHFDATGLDSCMQISYLWGDNPVIIDGPYGNNTAVWHTYSGPGIYNVCYFIEQVTPGDSICWTYEHCEDIEIICDTCQCGDFTDMFIRWGGAPSQEVGCGEEPVTLGCPAQGLGFVLTGAFECDGNLCPAEDTLSWTLTGSGNTHSGTSIAYPYFTINLLPNYFALPGLYSLTLQGHCGNSECICVINFIIDCPDLCPCEPDDIQALDNSVNQGFAQTLYANSCKACFSPIALSDCEKVEWHLGSINNSVIATSVGNQTICHNFNNSGTYTVIMVVTRLRSDGTICEVFVKSQTVTVSCVPFPICDMSIFPNPGFEEGAIDGGLNSGGASVGWVGILGDPKLRNGVEGSLNDWTIELQSNNNDTVDVLSTLDPVCINKGTGVISMRMEHGIKEKGIKSSIIISLLRGDDYTLGNDWNTTDCHRLVELDISPIDTGEWVDIEIPYDISSWLAEDECIASNGVLVRPVIRQRCCSNPTARRIVNLDYFCMDKMIVSTNEIPNNQSINLFPNPTTGELTIHFDKGFPRNSQIQILDLMGRVVQTEMVTNGHNDFKFTLDMKLSGVYFIKITENEMPIWIEKIIKL